jgi:hypothetical protein
MSITRRFVGVWERELLEIDGDVVTGIGRALWIESGGTYVDVRGEGSVASGTSFGGRSAWRSPAFTWHHDLDLHPRPGSIDRGALTFATPDRIVERGTGIAGLAAPYVEHWRRLAGPHVETAIATHEHGLAVRVGDYAGVIVRAHPGGAAWARAWQQDDGRWFEVIALAAGEDLPVPQGSGWRLPRGWDAR